MCNIIPRTGRWGKIVSSWRGPCLGGKGRCGKCGADGYYLRVLVPMSKWVTILLQASRDFGRDPCPGPKLEGYLKDAGFKNVQAFKFKLPIGPWPKDKRLVRSFSLPPPPPCLTYNVLIYVPSSSAQMFQLFALGGID